jgi:hypothetical protein
MSKFKKRLQKIVKKSLDSVILVNANEKDFGSVVESFQTVFLIGQCPVDIKSKNLIPIKDLTFTSTIYGIDAIFVNQGFDENQLSFLNALLRRCQPCVFLNLDFNITQEYRDFFAKLRYEQVDVNDGYQIWKVIKL